MKVNIGLPFASYTVFPLSFTFIYSVSIDIKGINSKTKTSFFISILRVSLKISDNVVS